METLLTSTEAAALLGVDRTTTRRAAASGLVPGARQEARPGTINPPWVATREAWQHWFDTRRPAGRPQPPSLSRADTAVITRAEWVPDPKELKLYWWTVWLDKLPDVGFRIAGIYNSAGSPTHAWAQGQFALGNTISLGDLSFCPVPTGIMAYAETERGVVLAAIGRIRDRLEPYCGPLVYLVPRCKTRSDMVDPSEVQLAALESALGELMRNGVKAAIASLEKSGLFSHVFHDGEGCPAAPGNLTDGVFEWRP